MLKGMLLEQREFSLEELKSVMVGDGYELIENHSNKLVFGQLFDEDNIVIIDYYKIDEDLIYINNVL